MYVGPSIRGGLVRRLDWVVNEISLGTILIMYCDELEHSKEPG